MNEHEERQTEIKPPRKRSWKNDSEYQLAAADMGSAEIRTCFEKDWERKMSDSGNTKGIIKRVLYHYKVKKKKFMLKGKSF